MKDSNKNRSFLLRNRNKCKVKGFIEWFHCVKGFIEWIKLLMVTVDLTSEWNFALSYIV